MKKILFLLYCCFIALAGFGQTNQWAWIGGANVPNDYAVYGIKGVASPTNKPGARYQSVSWTDAAGDLWLFGGNGNTATTTGPLNDLWKYNTSTRQWTWVSGDSITFVAGVYGIKGIADPANKPGARMDMLGWKDASNNLWLFGGAGFLGLHNDLWKSNIGTGLWTWVSGDNTLNSASVYGTKGIADPANKPGGKNNASSWYDNAGNLWLFGGDQHGSTNEYYNDLWKYNISSGEWTWMSGDNTPFSDGVYGTKGIADPANKPGARNCAASWTDHSGNLWLFGGEAHTSAPTGNANDLWKYNISSGQWTWVNGDNTLNQPGVYGTKGIGNPANKPGGGWLSTAWTDTDGNLWMFGGWSIFPSMIGSYSNTLWKYNINSNEWTWVTGNNIAFASAVYGTMGVYDPANTPGPRWGSVGWTDVLGSFYLFGGFATSTMVDNFNDLWNFNPATIIPLKLLSFDAQLHNKKVLLNWQTENEINIDGFDIERSTDAENFTAIASVNAKTTATQNSYVYLDNHLPKAPVIFYRLKIKSMSNLTNYSEIKKVFTVGQPTRIGPNPAKDQLFVCGEQLSSLKFYDSKGVMIKSAVLQKNGTTNISLNGIIPGNYLVIIYDIYGQSTIQKIIIK